MSLPSQRPNYVLVWIGIVMLTFSMAGNWLLESPSFPSTNLADSARLSIVYEDSAFLPPVDSAQEDLVPKIPQEVENVFDQQIPVRRDEYFLKDQTLAKHEVDLGPPIWETGRLSLDSQPELLEITINDAVIPRKGISPVHDGLGLGEEQWQSFRSKALPATAPRNRKQKAADAWDQGQYNSSWSNRKGFANRGKKGAGKNREIFIQTHFRPAPNGRIAASFFLARPHIQGRIEFLQGNQDAMLAQRAEQYLDALEAVIRESQENASEQGAQSQKREQLEQIRQMKAKLLEHLRQRPGGIELVAELSQIQLEAFMQKLSAQNPRFRALLKS
ncbi:MAG: hypothetical protein QM477_05340 [Planctomycetota bacterium]